MLLECKKNFFKNYFKIHYVDDPDQKFYLAIKFNSFRIVWKSKIKSWIISFNIKGLGWNKPKIYKYLTVCVAKWNSCVVAYFKFKYKISTFYW